MDNRMKQDCSAFEETVFFKNIENRIFTKLVAVRKDEVRLYLSFNHDRQLKKKCSTNGKCVAERNSCYGNGTKAG
jgi:hypothetical protein